MYGSPIKRPLVRREPSTPSKQRKTVDLLTPGSTPQPKKQDYEPTSPIKPVNLFETTLDTSKVSDEKKPPQSTQPGQHLSIYAQGKAIFQRGSQYRKVIGRTEERAHLTDHIKRCVGAHTSGALYVSGLPGTGKSALVGEVLKESQLTSRKDVKVAQINCMTIDKADQTYAVIAKEFGLLARKAAKDKTQSLDLLQREFSVKNTTHILVLDELDRIMTTDQEVLFKIFEWACGTSNLLVIGIANAIDLTDRFLPRLQAHKLKPEVIAFKPYTAQGITQIIESRLKQLDGQLMHPAAVRICAAKTAANSGDLRKAFDICRRAVENVEEEASTAKDEAAGTRLVLTSHVAKVCQVAFGGVRATERLNLLNFQQRAVLCVLMKSERNSASSNITVLQAFQDYEFKCTQNKMIKGLNYSEYVEVVNALDAAGLVAVTGLCGKKGLGTHGNIRKSRGGIGSSGSNANAGYRDEFSLRKISSRAQVLDIVQELDQNDPLRIILMD